MIFCVGVAFRVGQYLAPSRNSFPPPTRAQICFLHFLSVACFPFFPPRIPPPLRQQLRHCMSLSSLCTILVSCTLTWSCIPICTQASHKLMHCVNRNCLQLRVSSWQYIFITMPYNANSSRNCWIARSILNICSFANHLSLWSWMNG